MSDQVQAVRRKLVGSLNKAAIDHAVEAYGYSREKLEEVLVLCGGKAETMAKHWNGFRATPEQVAKDAASHSDFELDEFIAYVRDEIVKEKQHGRTDKRRRRNRRRHR